jgi:hypothetical protein
MQEVTILPNDSKEFELCQSPPEAIEETHQIGPFWIIAESFSTRVSKEKIGGEVRKIC